LSKNINEIDILDFGRCLLYDYQVVHSCDNFNINGIFFKVSFKIFGEEIAKGKFKEIYKNSV